MSRPHSPHFVFGWISMKKSRCSLKGMGQPSAQKVSAGTTSCQGGEYWAMCARTTPCQGAGCRSTSCPGGEGQDYLRPRRWTPLTGGRRGSASSSWANREKWSEGMSGCGQPVMLFSTSQWWSRGPRTPSVFS